MNERLLQYIWQFQYFQTGQLRTTDGRDLQIIHPGIWNTHQGPDFTQGQVRIADTTWAGNIELHLKASDWFKHRHQHDDTYNKIILHVIWEADTAVTDDLGNAIPTLELQGRVSRLMLQQYEAWMHSQQPIACRGQWQSVPEVKRIAWWQRLLVSRLENKVKHIEQLLEQHQGHWEEVCWRMICRYFGGSVNAESFEQIAATLPIALLARHKQQIHQLEALLLGQAGLLHNRFTEDYPQMLYKEYSFLQKKYGLRVINKPPVFLRLRPPSFPTVRLAQLAMLVSQSTRMLSRLVAMEQIPYQLFEVTANDYWHYHYKLDEPTTFSEKHLGRTMVDIVLINAVIPVLYAYGRAHAAEGICEKAIQWMEHIPAEQNSVIKPWLEDGCKVSSAYETQALLELTKNYCHPRRCLECGIGHYLLKGNPDA